MNEFWVSLYVCTMKFCLASLNIKTDRVWLEKNLKTGLENETLRCLCILVFSLWSNTVCSRCLPPHSSCYNLLNVFSVRSHLQYVTPKFPPNSSRQIRLFLEPETEPPQFQPSYLSAIFLPLYQWIIINHVISHVSPTPPFLSNLKKPSFVLCWFCSWIAS